ncbi:MAG: zinc ribbon domain-containing protein [Candidatus Thorarchaeota archaeon]
MTDRQKERLSRITSRDTRVIRAFLGVIARHEKDLLVGKRRKRISGAKLEKLTLTAERFKDKSKNRTSVPHDFKRKFPNISVNELQECRQVAAAMWQSYLELGGRPPLEARGYRPRKLPRYVYARRFKIVYTPEKEIRHWLRLMDSLDSAKMQGAYHDYLIVPLSPSSYHLNRLSEGTVTSLRLLKDSRKKWWAIFAVRLNVPAMDNESKPPAVLGIDLGINKAVCSVVLTHTKIRHVRYFTQPEKVKRIRRYDEMVDSLQREKNTRLNSGQPADGVIRKLRELSGRRNQISIDHDGVLIKQLTDHALELSEKYDLYVAIGRLTGIRTSASRANGKSKWFRSMVARWSFARVTNGLKHSLARNGWRVSGRDSRFIPVREFWTSKKCHKCGHIGIRPKQSLFICHTCGYRANADKNGVINIARRLVMLIPRLRDENQGLGRWLLPHERGRSTLKARRSSRSEGKSSRSQSLSGSKGPSVAECCTQTSLVEFADATDPAMVRTAETPSAAIDARKAADSRGNMGQLTEAQSGGRDTVPVISGEARVITSESDPMYAGDSRHEKGETRELKVSGGVHSPQRDI